MCARRSVHWTKFASEEKRSPLSKTEQTKQHTDGRYDLPGRAAKKGTAAKSKKKRENVINQKNLRAAAVGSEQQLAAAKKRFHMSAKS